MPPLSLLVIDDDLVSLELLSGALAQPGLEILVASDPKQALDIFEARRPRIVLTDLNMPDIDGLEVLDRIMAVDPATDVILITAHDSPQTAVEAIRKGACDYLTKPVSIQALRERVAELVRSAAPPCAPRHLDGDLSAHTHLKGIVGASRPMRDMFEAMRNVATLYQTLLLTGETGTGKDLVARAIHELSPVANAGRYVVLNCSAVVEGLFESELFGHVKGSFTGAAVDKPGLVEHAHGGTLFLDEIGDMPLGAQAKMLRVLQNREVQRVGAMTSHKVDIRVIAATNRDLRADVAEGRFREDLYYRLSMVEIAVPPLAARKEDLPLLERHFVSHFAAMYGKDVTGLTNHARARLARHSWPGNVRELENAIGYAAMMTFGPTIDSSDLPPYLQSEGLSSQPTQNPSGALSEQERQLLIRALEAADGNQSKAARILRIGRDALRYKVRKYNLHALEKAGATTTG
jgi:DNA-binding NtrC family response regulator